MTASLLASERHEFDDSSSNSNVFELYVAENETLDREILFHIRHLFPYRLLVSFRVAMLRYARNLNGSGKAAQRVSGFSNDFLDPVRV